MDNGVNFLQQREEEQGEEDKDGANFIQEGGGQYASQGSNWPYNKHGKKKSNDTDVKVDGAKEAACLEKEATPQAAPHCLCIHCGGQYDLTSCPDLTTNQLGQILCQIVATEDNGDDDRLDGGSLQQA